MNNRHSSFRIAVALASPIKKPTKEGLMTAREAHELTNQFYKDLDAIWSRLPHYSPDGMVWIMANLVFGFARDKLGREGACNLFGEFGPPPKRYLQERRKQALAKEYGLARKPNLRTRKSNKAAFATMEDFAEAAARWNVDRPWDERLGSGTTDTNNMLRDLKRMLQKKKYSDIANYWCVMAPQRGLGTRLL
jgi:hypothetical protein